MAIREIPAAFEHVCDGCKKSARTTSKARPKYWSDLTLARDAYDYQGCAVADGTICRSLCDECAPKVEAAINGAIAKAEGR